MSDSTPKQQPGESAPQNPPPEWARPDHWLPPRPTQPPPRPGPPRSPSIGGAAPGWKSPAARWNASPPPGVQPLQQHGDLTHNPPPQGAWARIALVVLAVAVVVAMVVGFTGPMIRGALRLPPVAPTASSSTPASQPTPSTINSPRPTTMTPTTTTPKPTTPPPEPVPPQWQLPEQDWPPLPTPSPQDEIWEQLQARVLSVEPPAVLVGCPAPQTVDREQEFREKVAQQWHCVHRAWTPRLEVLGFSTVEPAIKFYAGSGADSDCGHLEAPAFYCAAGDGTAYFGAGHMVMAMEWDLSINEMVNHEYGHHLQNLAGVSNAKVQLGMSSENERRAELQATCWSAAMTRNSQDVAFDQGDWDSWQRRLETMLIDGVHGSRESILQWGTRGLYAHTMGDCNTWAVDIAEVS